MANRWFLAISVAAIVLTVVVGFFGEAVRTIGFVGIIILFATGIWVRIKYEVQGDIGKQKPSIDEMPPHG